MSVLVWIGAAMALAGLGGLGWCIREAGRVRRTNPTPEEARKVLMRLTPVNLGSVAVAFLGLGLVAVALILS